MKIIVTGAHGFLGRCLLGMGGEHEWIGWSRSMGAVGYVPCVAVDLADRALLTGLLEEHRPDWVINTAATTNVDGCELDPVDARRVNVGMVENLVAACQAADVGLAHVSTDYVFDGENGPYGEEDPTGPLSTYGALKLESERVVLGGLKRGIVVRTMWLYGYATGTRPNMLTWPLQTLARGETLRIVADQWGNPTYAADLARALVDLCALDSVGLWHVGGGSFMTRYEQVVQLALFFGLNPDRVAQGLTADLAQPARRPLRSGLSTDALRRHLGWEPMSFSQSLEDVLHNGDFCRDFSSIISARNV